MYTKNKRALEEILFSEILEELLREHLPCLFFFFKLFFSNAQFCGDTLSRIFIFIMPQQNFTYNIQCAV